MRGAKAEDVAAHRDQPADFKLQSDQKHQHHDAELGDRQDGFGGAENTQSERPDHDAGDEIGDDRGDAEPARDRHADHRGAEERERHRKKSDLVGSVHADTIQISARCAFDFFLMHNRFGAKRATMLLFSSWPGLSPQVGYTRLAALNYAQLGQARVALPSTSLVAARSKTWMPGNADKFTQSAQARLRAGHDGVV